MGIEKPHYSVGHFCGSCPVSNRLHFGCVVDNSVRVVDNNPKKNKVSPVSERPHDQMTNEELIVDSSTI